MAKQNNKKRFAGKAQQDEKTKRTIQRETKSGEKKNRKKKPVKNKWNIAICLVPIVAVIDIGFVCHTYSWAEEVGKSSVYLDFIADSLLNTVMVVIELFLLLGTIIFAFKRKYLGACITVSLILVVILIGLLAARLKVAASVKADEEMAVAINKERRETESMEAMTSMQNQTVYQLRKYSLEEDLFVENLEQYCDIAENEISQEKRPEITAEIILAYLESNVVDEPEKKLPYSYETNVLMANVLYNTFSDLNTEGKKTENSSIKSEIFGYALKTLEESLKCRIEADNSHHTAENRRLIGVYYIDAGVCRQSIDGIDSAVASYENAAEWAVKSIYSAAIENDLEAMGKAWSVLNNAADKIEKVEGSGDGDSVQKVKNIRDAYKIVIDQWKGI